MSTPRGQAHVAATTLVGTHAIDVDVQIDVGAGLPSFTIVGLGDAAVLEARERVRAAIRASGFAFPNARVVVNLAPGPVRKHGTGFDLPIALGILIATSQALPLRDRAFRAVGELGLDGSVRPVPGMLAHGLAARDAQAELIGAAAAADVLSELAGLTYRPVEALGDVLDSGVPIRLRRREHLAPPQPDLADVAGQEFAKRALEIAAAGGHHVLFTGPPGSGKTMLARRLPGILPHLDDDERVSSALVHSVAGLDERALLAGVRPFRAPHHSASIAGLVGGGSPPRPGEVSLAHNGVLFLDELPEFGPSALQTLRQPMEDGTIALVRAEGRVRFPARFSLIAAANPCPCGFSGDPQRQCACAPGAVIRYRNRIGGPLMDRIDLVVNVERLDPSLIVASPQAEATARVAERVGDARERAIHAGRSCNASVSVSALIGPAGADAGIAQVVAELARIHALSGRGVTRLVRVARTIADLEGRPHIEKDHIVEAAAYRKQDR